MAKARCPRIGDLVTPHTTTANPKQDVPASGTWWHPTPPWHPQSRTSPNRGTRGSVPERGEEPGTSPAPRAAENTTTTQPSSHQIPPPNPPPAHGTPQNLRPGAPSLAGTRSRVTAVGERRGPAPPTPITPKPTRCCEDGKGGRTKQNLDASPDCDHPWLQPPR